MRLAIIVGFSSVGIALVIGGCFGLLAGYLRGKADTVTMRGMDVLFAFPELILAISVIAALGPSAWTAVIAIAIVYIPRFARIARVSTNAWIPYLPYSRPTPEYLNPPHGACGSSVMLLITTRPARS